MTLINDYDRGEKPKLVCSACLTETCAAGDLMCDKARTAGFAFRRQRDTPAPVTIAAPEQQIGIAIADTPAGQRLAITITCLLPAEQARQLADAISQAARSMSTAGLVVAGGTVTR